MAVISQRTGSPIGVRAVAPSATQSHNFEPERWFCPRDDLLEPIQREMMDLLGDDDGREEPFTGEEPSRSPPAGGRRHDAAWQDGHAYFPRAVAMTTKLAGAYSQFLGDRFS